MYFRQKWIDKRLGYSDGENLLSDELRLTPNQKIWTPNTYFAVGDVQTSSDKSLITVAHDGLVMYSKM